MAEFLTTMIGRLPAILIATMAMVFATQVSANSSMVQVTNNGSTLKDCVANDDQTFNQIRMAFKNTKCQWSVDDLSGAYVCDVTQLSGTQAEKCSRYGRLCKDHGGEWKVENGKGAVCPAFP